MSMIIGALRAVFGADTAAFEKGVDEVERKLKSAERKFSSFGKKIASAGNAMSIGFTAPLVAVGALSFKTATDMQELESAFDVTFGNSSDHMRDFAKETASAMGRSRKEIQESSVAFASLFNKALAPGQANALTKEFAILTQDLASFKDLSNEVAQQKLFSGLTGEAEPLRAVGVFINAAAVEAKALEIGLEKVNGKYTDQQKIVARARLIQEQLANANGDVIKTYDSTANQLKRAEARFIDVKIAIGTQLLPVLTPMIEKVADLFDWFANLDAGMQQNIIVTAAVVAGMGPMLSMMGNMVIVGPKVALALVKITSGLSAMGVATGVALGPLTLIVATVGLAVAAFVSFALEVRRAKKAKEEFYALLKENEELMTREKASTIEQARLNLEDAKSIRTRIQAKLEEQRVDLEAAKARLNKKNARIANRGNGGGISAGERRKVAELTEEIAKSQRALALNLNEIDKLGKEYRVLEKTTKDVKVVTAATAAAQLEAAKAAEKQAEKAKKLAEAHVDVKNATADELKENKLLAEALQISSREYDIVAEKLKLVEDGFRGTDAEARAMAISLVDSREHLDGIRQAANDNAAALREQADEQKRVADAMAESVKKAVEAHNELKQSHADEIESNRLLTEAMRISSREYDIVAEQLRILESGFAGTRAEARAMAEELVTSREQLSAVTDETKKTEDALKKAGKSGVDSFTAAANSFNDFLGALESGDLAGILEGIGGLLSEVFGSTGGGTGGGAGGGFGEILNAGLSLFGGGKATGGPVSKGVTYLVGEEGPELFTPPSSGNIVPNDKLGGGALKLEIDAGPMFATTVRQEAAGVAAPIAEVTTTRGVGQYNRTRERSRKQRLA